MKRAFVYLKIFVIGYLLVGCNVSNPSNYYYTTPDWLPADRVGVRYYYYPDIETYYDLSSGNFVYLDRGQWIFSPMFPSIYSGFDLYNGFYVALNFNVYKPWLYHQNYLFHYPKYYYKNVFRPDEFKNIRGFNEYKNKPDYWRQDDRDRINKLKSHDPFQNNEHRSIAPHEPVYKGKEIGSPVKVRPNMRESRPSTRENNPNINPPSRNPPSIQRGPR
jgi:hypothetical protein